MLKEITPSPFTVSSAYRFQLFPGSLEPDRGEGAHHSSSCCLGTDGRKGRIGFGAVHDGTETMRVGLNLDSNYRKMNATRLTKMLQATTTQKAGARFVDNTVSAGNRYETTHAQPQDVAPKSTGHLSD